MSVVILVTMNSIYKTSQVKATEPIQMYKAKSDAMLGIFRPKNVST